MCNILPPFLTHCFIKRTQAESYEKDKAYSLSEQSDTSMLQVDFAENYTCLAQDEVQSAHWKQSQITLFTCVTWFRGKTQPVVVSDNLKHDKTAVIIFTDQILSLKPTDAKIVNIWSDGLSSQFKNRFVFKALDFLTGKHDIINWNFFATSHAVDGVGAALKCRAWEKTKNRLCIINDLEGFITAVSDLKNVIIFKITNTELEERSTYFNLSEIFQSAIPVPKISECHALTNLGNNVLITKLNSSQELNEDDKIDQTTEIESSDISDCDIGAGKMVAVHLAGKLKEIAKVYMALVVEIDGEDVYLLYMARAGCFYHWLLVEDQSWQDKTDIICVVPQPTYRMNSRDKLEFASNVLDFVEKKALEKRIKQVQFA